MEKNIFVERLRLAREEKGMGLKELREAVGISQSAMSHYSTGATIPALDVADRIAKVLGVSLDWLCGKDEISAPENSFGYIARMMMKIVYELRGIGVSISAYQGDYVKLTIEESGPLYSFFKKNERYQEMARENEEAKEMYMAWLTGELNKMDGMEIFEREQEAGADAEKEAGGE